MNHLHRLLHVKTATFTPSWQRDVLLGTAPAFLGALLGGTMSNPGQTLSGTTYGGLAGLLTGLGAVGGGRLGHNVADSLVDAEIAKRTPIAQGAIKSRLLSDPQSQASAALSGGTLGGSLTGGLGGYYLGKKLLRGFYGDDALIKMFGTPSATEEAAVPEVYTEQEALKQKIQDYIQAPFV